eukprot:301727-Amorphochlora_amoeboformis.AAC.1
MTGHCGCCWRSVGNRIRVFVGIDGCFGDHGLDLFPNYQQSPRLDEGSSPVSYRSNAHTQVAEQREKGDDAHVSRERGQRVQA